MKYIYYALLCSVPITSSCTTGQNSAVDSHPGSGIFKGRADSNKKDTLKKDSDTMKKNNQTNKK